jgi:hypothetical protein
MAEERKAKGKQFFFEKRTKKLLITSSLAALKKQNRMAPDT